MPHDEVFQSIAAREIVSGISTFTGSTTTSVVTIAQTGNEKALSISTTSADKYAIEITGCKYGLKITPNVEAGWSIYSVSAVNGGYPLVHFASTSATNAYAVLSLANGGTAATLLLATTGTNSDIHLTPRAAAGVTGGSEGGVYYNLTAHKLMVRGAAGWETVTSA